MWVSFGNLFLKVPQYGATVIKIYFLVLRLRFYMYVKRYKCVSVCIRFELGMCRALVSLDWGKECFVRFHRIDDLSDLIRS